MQAPRPSHDCSRVTWERYGSSTVVGIFPWRLGNPIPFCVGKFNMPTWKCIQKSSWQPRLSKSKLQQPSKAPWWENGCTVVHSWEKTVWRAYYKTIAIYFSVLEAENPTPRCRIGFPLTASLIKHLRGKRSEQELKSILYKVTNPVISPSSSWHHHGVRTQHLNLRAI